ncbi:MAG: PhnD/SsuA/transferrin family substrate-binding protein [Methylophilaceae bacterium]|uniref:sterol transporter periplasmic substrate-binding protein BstB n=1 Tax=Methylicorpusculum sp. TaxID=2713644 RepID=UPI002730B0FF|nr:sterol transporter periplasmic substrate-binding protein BstB [Methylicorpusculum sp.]MDP2177285.1 PhnD/SsuA/transferrin family substrate-binding protein [Methylicorpusculum sp.]MDP3531210.1 PhnD/SsuA/transferrin family substrate-binding protein [Methylicorpusculum sp.]MDZ4099807.1 PhnD/SsuA/transferrin family substrate-binding protein [Methylophilaceae bacterium]
MQKICLFILAGLAASFVTNAAPNPEMIVVCYPGGSVNEKDANGAMTSMLRVVERVGQWQENSFNSLFTAKSDECRKQMAGNKPKFAITSLGLFLELRNQHNLVPVVQPRIKGLTHERYRVMVQKDKFKNLDELKGKTLGGTVLEESSFIGKIVFAGKYDPDTFFVLEKSNQAIRALRSLNKGELDAVILNEQQFGGLSSLQMDTTLDAVFTSEEIPLMGVVANSATTTADERVRFGKALEGMCSDSEGKKLCELFGVEAFATVDSAVFEPMIKLWATGQ